MLSSIRIENFRSIEDTKQIKLSKLNVIVGPNNSGKSSLMYPLLLIKQTLEEKNSKPALITSGQHIDLGSFLDLLRGHDSTKSLGISFTLEKGAMPLLHDGPQ